MTSTGEAAAAAPTAMRTAALPAVAALAGGSAGVVLGAGLTPGTGRTPDLPWCAAALTGAALALLAVLLHRRAQRHRPGWAPAAGLLLTGGALPAAATSDSPWCAGLAASAAVFTVAATAPRAAVVAGAAAALAAGACLAAAAPSATAAALGTLAGIGGLLLVADLPGVAARTPE
ncbi:hypothetical protein F7Q99_02115 [Streptomyces kaniharaensis]|uniref:Uncharacterized protein n=1 Tax=Streptomyces kaniharaensis TaxID=212423 RepID=A0A6N7KHZ8_9ACTN|nr:hypothetical protein [Streptomyces kaniharaensis]MQS11110.1 hypothetical protein [Streptomyces kaniharaensis]